MHRRVIRAAIAAAVFLASAPTAGQAPPARLTLTDARMIIAAAQRSAAPLTVQVTIAVVDARGDLIALERQPAASAASVDAAIGKAMLSAIFLRPSGTFRADANPASPITAVNESTGGRLRFVPGGVPVVRGGVLLGAVAASGATPQQDETIAAEGAAAIP